MKIYLVFGIEFHGCRELLGVYDSMELAIERKYQIRIKDDYNYDELIIKEIKGNTDL